MSEIRKMPKSLYAKSANELLGAVGLDKSFQGKQLYKWLNTGVIDFKEMTNLPKTIREFLVSSMGSPLSSHVIEVSEDGSDATKLAIELFDGRVIEAVILSDDNGRNTACLSSQVGCAMGCAFCRTGTMGLVRNLFDYEIVEQFIPIIQLAPNTTHIVFMGMGEPLANREHVFKAIEHLHHPEGLNISLRRMTMSTCGLIPGILALAELNIPVRLAMSLTTADENQRDLLMPINKRYGLDELKKALIHYQNIMKKRFTLEYVMLSRENMSEYHAKKLALLVRNLDVIVNLIPYNPASELSFVRPGRNEISKFTTMLDALGVPHTKRMSKGQSINGACGQLATQYEDDED
ncbi:MAG: 23S rRNA (adenine(2503)-C(2))-methyltransferase RlmN [Bacteroidales bacterium]|jgi:23S rRNA (adenine2503-C2)-methyltransferase|nr:23S rRNA (adenine(2503)-C(2))-methyltransferase RlmN [Bacteroidales bacterium]